MSQEGDVTFYRSIRTETSTAEAQSEYHRAQRSSHLPSSKVKKQPGLTGGKWVDGNKRDEGLNKRSRSVRHAAATNIAAERSET